MATTYCGITRAASLLAYALSTQLFFQYENSTFPASHETEGSASLTRNRENQSDNSKYLDNWMVRF